MKEAPGEITSAVSRSAEFGVKGCCCFCDKGSGIITTQFEKDVYTQHETAKAISQVNAEKVDAPADSVQITLTSHLRLSAGYFSRADSRSVLSNAYEGVDPNTDSGPREYELDLRQI